MSNQPSVSPPISPDRLTEIVANHQKDSALLEDSPSLIGHHVATNIHEDRELLLRMVAWQDARIAELLQKNGHLSVMGRYAEQNVEELHEEIGHALELLPKSLEDSPLHLETWHAKSILNQVLESTRKADIE